MSKSKNKSTLKPRDKYDKPLKINGSFLDVMKVIVKDADNKDKKSISKP